MNQSKNELFSELTPSTIGTILYQTKVFEHNQQQQINAKITNSLVIIGEKCVKFSFDICFSVNQQDLTFYLEEQEKSFKLVLNDYLKWRGYLKLFINQKGFHEQFKAVKKIGQGNFASVYLVKGIQNGQQYAVKAFSKESAYSQQNGKQCLIKQISIMRSLNHQNNMKLQEVFQSDNSIYLVFQLLNDGILYQMIKSKKVLPQNEIKKIIYDILLGLRQMHSKGIMHRDLKPQNILMRNKTDCVIADFGLAEFVDSQKYLFTRCGTPGYVAPEVINITDMNDKYGSVCDMFSLGLIFYTLLFGKSIFTGKTYNQVLKENRVCNFKLQGQQYDHLPYQTLDLLKKMLQINPKQRITSQQASHHPYFNSTDNIDQCSDCVLLSLPSPNLITKTSSISSSTQSPLLTSSNTQRRKNKQLKKDSCIGFKMGRDAGWTGRTETVGTLKSSKFGEQLLRNIDLTKIKSKFSQKQQKLEKEKSDDIVQKGKEQIQSV